MQQGVQRLGQRSASNSRWILSLLLSARGSATLPLRAGGTTQRSGCLMMRMMMIYRRSNMNMGITTTPGIVLQALQMTASEVWRSACASVFHHCRFTFSCHGRCLQITLRFHARACLPTLLVRQRESPHVALGSESSCTVCQDEISSVVEEADRLY